MNLIKISTDLELTVHEFPTGSYSEQNEVLRKYIGSTCETYEHVIPFDVDKIQRDCKYFSRDTVTIALGLFRKLGLIYEQDSDGGLAISGFSNLVGSETDYALQKRLQRQPGGQLADKQMDNTDDSNADSYMDSSVDNCMDKPVDIVHKKFRRTR